MHWQVTQMFQSISNYIHTHKNALQTSSIVLCGLLSVRKYVSNRLEDMRYSVEQERSARNK
jgi:hypothetical protein